jgi:hypothetical protein
MGRNVDRFARNADRAGSNLGMSWNRLRGVFAAVVAAITTGAAAKALVDFADRGDDISDVSKRIGMSAESLQEFRYAANMADLTADDLTSVLQKMNNSMGQLRTGTGSLYTYLKATNPQLALQLKNTRNSETAFTLLMNAIAAEGDVAKRAALAQAAFGRSGQELIDMAGDLNKRREEARASGTIISNADVQAAAAMHENLLKLKASGQGFINEVLGRAVAAIGPWLDKLTLWISNNRELIGQKIDATINFIAGAAKTAYDIFSEWWPVLVGVGVAIIAMNIAMKAAAIIAVMSKAISIASAVMGMFQAGASLATVAQWALNAAMAANPIGLIITAIGALIALIALLAANWDKVVAFFKNMQKEILKVVIKIIAWFIELRDKIIGAFDSAIKWIVDAFNKVVNFFKGIIDWIKGAFDKIGGFFKGIFGAGGDMKAEINTTNTPVSPNTGLIASNVTTTRNSQLDVNFRNPPAGTEMRQSGEAPGITINTGPTFAMGGAR